MHTICTQYAHTQKQKQKYNMQHIQDNTEQNTEHSTEQYTQNSTQPQHTCSAHNYRTYSFDFIVEDYISKNSIIQLYTNFIQTIYILLALLMR